MEDQQITPASTPLDNFFNIAFDAGTRAQVKQAALWAKICTLCAFGGYAVALVVAFLGRRRVVSDGALELTEPSRVSIMLILTTLVSTAIGVLINYFLYRFAISTARGMDNMDSIKTNEGFNNLRRYFKIYGILMIIVLCIAGLAVLFFLIGLGFRPRLDQ